jgi:hypothetical protein
MDSDQENTAAMLFPIKKQMKAENQLMKASAGS